MTFGKWSRTMAQSINGCKIKQVASFKYLGLVLQASRARKAHYGCNQMGATGLFWQWPEKEHPRMVQAEVTRYSSLCMFWTWNQLSWYRWLLLRVVLLVCSLQPSKWVKWQAWPAPKGSFGVSPILFNSGPSHPWTGLGLWADSTVWSLISRAAWVCSRAGPNSLSDCTHKARS